MSKQLHLRQLVDLLAMQPQKWSLVRDTMGWEQIFGAVVWFSTPWSAGTFHLRIQRPPTSTRRLWEPTTLSQNSCLANARIWSEGFWTLTQRLGSLWTISEITLGLFKWRTSSETKECSQEKKRCQLKKNCSIRPLLSSTLTKSTLRNALRITGITISLLATIWSTRETGSLRIDKSLTNRPKSTSRRRWDLETTLRPQKLWLSRLLTRLLSMGRELATTFLQHPTLLSRSKIWIWLLLFTQSKWRTGRLTSLQLKPLVLKWEMLLMITRLFNIARVQQWSKTFHSILKMTGLLPTTEGPKLEEIKEVCSKLEIQNHQSDTLSTQTKT